MAAVGVSLLTVDHFFTEARFSRMTFEKLVVLLCITLPKTPLCFGCRLWVSIKTPSLDQALYCRVASKKLALRSLVPSSQWNIPTALFPYIKIRRRSTLHSNIPNNNDCLFNSVILSSQGGHALVTIIITHHGPRTTLRRAHKSNKGGYFSTSFLDDGNPPGGIALFTPETLPTRDGPTTRHGYDGKRRNTTTVDTLSATQFCTFDSAFEKTQSEGCCFT